MIEAWEAYSNNPNNGKAAADMGVAMILARHDLYPKKCLQNRICPNCMFEQAKFFLSCPRCKGKFISAGVTNHSSPTMILTTKEEIDKMIRENEEALAQLHFPDDDALTEEMEVETQKDTKKEYSPHDEEMDDEEQTEEAEDTNVNDEANSIMVNYERLSQDLINYNGGCALNTDPDEKISRYILFKIADFCVHHFVFWKRYVFEETDNSRARLLARGCRHEVTGENHPVLRATLGGGFALDRGLPVTVDDATLYQVYHGRFLNQDTRIEAEEMARRYRFGVVVTKLVEALYRRGYDLEKEFRTRVQACNSMSDQTTIEAMRTPAQLKEDVGIVETAMKEAIRIAFPADCQTYSFFSPLNPPGNYRINVHEFQSFYAAKSKNKITGEMVHVMHYYDVQNVPSFEELTRKYKAKNEDKPVKLKYLSDSAASGMRGFNMLMPVSVEQAQSSGTQDVPMVEVEQTHENEVDEVEQTGETEVVENMSVEVVEVAELPTPEAPTEDIQMGDERDTTEAPKPGPPLAPLIETIEPETDTAIQTGEPSSGKTVEHISETMGAEDVAAGSSEGIPSGPVVLTPAKPRPPTPPKIMRANPKPAPKPGAVPKDVKPGKDPVTPKMTTEVRQVPKSKAEAKAMPKTPPHPPPARSRSTADTQANAYASAPEAITIDPIVPTEDINQQGSDRWVNYVGTGQDVRDQYLPTTTSQHNLPPRARSWTKGSGRWQPVSKGRAPTLSEAWEADQSSGWSSYEPSSSAKGKGTHEASSSSRGKGRGRGGKGRGSSQHWYENWIDTGFRGSIEDVRHLLQWYYPDQYDANLEEFWYCPSDGKWYVNGRHWRG